MSKPSSKKPGVESSSAAVVSPSASPSDARVTHWLLAVICFLSGASVMVIEISANRLLAPHFGNSIYTWTALIGVVLIALSGGAWLGGVLADKFGRVDLLATLLTGAAVLTMLIPVLSTWFSPGLSTRGLIAGPVFISLFLFALPAILLGAVSPASVRFYSMVNQDRQVGHAAGVISMLGSLGSFVGTFLSGFFLLSAFGVKSIFIGTGVLLLLLALIAFWMARKPAKQQAGHVGAIIAAGLVGYFVEAPVSAEVVHQETSFYHQITVKEPKNYPGARVLELDNTTEGGMRIADGGLILDYQNFWRLALLNENLKLERALFIGAGAFGMPEEVSRVVQGSHVDVVEIDPAVINVGRKFFKLDEHPNVHAHASDARRYLRQSEGNYDLIFGDAYSGRQHVPAHLVTQEFFAEVKSKLSPNGVFLMNLISATQGEKSELLSYILGTLRRVFPHVEVFAVGNGGDVQNIILLGSNQSWKPWLEDKYYLPSSREFRMVSRRLLERQLPAEAGPLTDDKNPADAIVARQLLH
ncbi:spermine/spermidine synthase [Roseimicrobium gellanilyticum]|uniref:Spermine/spermidine synthase n=1 Tax=Roseimicrobium gellanilyticum TaxID=748857 RepID=A0A366HB80_9BACT|nr:fused MFS/spermidine synthase [Roseimicrobium gellanilyticum]RBP39159.1 spermine/spermidine synthase [Roseimicrobium gellanilyticum]